MTVEQLIIDKLDLWTSATTHKATSGRGRNGKLELTGLKKLRELILELAVRGKLVPQDPTDEPASVLLEKIAAEKARLVKEGKIKKPKALPEIAEDKKPFDLPEGWEWARTGSFIIFTNGYAFKSADFITNGNGVVKIGDIQGGVIACNNMSRVNDAVVTDLDESLKVCPNDMVIAMSGATTGKLGFNKTSEVFYLNQRVGKIDPILICKNFLYIFLETRIEANLSISMGSAIPNLSTSQVNEISVAVPPLAEQHRIVEKVDELMGLCDRIENRTLDHLAAHETLADTLLDTLTQADSAAELADNWNRLAAHFDTLFTTEQSIDRLKQTILQLAVMGRLVPQDPTDEPASVLLEKITAEKARLVKEGKIKKQKPLPEIDEDEIPYKIPIGWILIRLDDICFGITSGSTPPQSHFIETSGIPYIKVYNIRNQEIDFKYKPQYIDEEYHAKSLKRSILKPGDVLMNIVGPPLGKTAIVPNEYPEWNCNQAIVFFRPIEASLNTYIHLYLKAGSFLKNIDLIGTAGQDNISVTKSRSIVLPLPPLAEQHRIVQKVDTLMALCDQLKARLTQADDTRRHLATALVEQAIQ